MSILPAVTIPPDYASPCGENSTWAIGQSRKAITLMGGNTEADNALQIVEIGAETFSYMEGSSSTPPLEADRVSKIKEDLFSIKSSGLKPLIVIRIIAHGISIIQSYTSLYNLIAKNPTQPLLPFDDVLAPLANFFLKGEGFLDDIEAWEKAQGTENENAAIIKVVGSTANLLLLGAQVFAFLAMTKVHIALQVTFSTITFSATIYEAISNKSNESASLKKEIETPLKISMMV